MEHLQVVESQAARWNRQREALWRESAVDLDAQALEKALREGLEDGRDLLVRFVARKVPGQFSVGIIPERWHVIRKGRGDNEVDHYLPIVGPNLEYREPEVSFVEEMKAMDLAGPGKLEAFLKRREANDQSIERAKQTQREQRVDEFVHNYEAARRTKGSNALKHFKKKSDEGE